MLLLSFPWFDRLHVLVVQVFKPLKLEYLFAFGNKLGINAIRYSHLVNRFPAQTIAQQVDPHPIIKFFLRCKSADVALEITACVRLEMSEVNYFVVVLKLIGKCQCIQWIVRVWLEFFGFRVINEFDVKHFGLHPEGTTVLLVFYTSACPVPAEVSFLVGFRGEDQGLHPLGKAAFRFGHVNDIES